MPDYMDALEQLASVYSHTGYFSRSIPLYRQCIVEHRAYRKRVPTHSIDHEILLLIHFGNVTRHAGNREEGAFAHQEAFALSPQTQDLRVIGLLHHTLGENYFAEGAYRLAWLHLDKALSDYRQTNIQIAEASVLNQMGGVAVHQSLFAISKDLFAECERIATQINRPDTITWVHLYSGDGARAQGDFETALRFYNIGREYWANWGHPGWVRHYLVRLAETYALMGAWEEVKRFCQELGEPPAHLQGMLAYQAGDDAEAQRYFQTALNGYEQWLRRREMAQTMLQLALVAARQDREAARDWLNRADALYREMEVPLWRIEQALRDEIERLCTQGE